jgi:hypothetical protein
LTVTNPVGVFPETESHAAGFLQFTHSSKAAHQARLALADLI